MTPPKRRPALVVSTQIIHQLQLVAASMTDAPVRETSYTFRPEAFLQEQLSVRLHPNFSLEWARDAAIGWLHGHARERYNRTGEDPVEFCQRTRPDLPVWEPGQPVVNTIVLQGGAGLGKSVVVSGLLLWAGHVSRNFTGAVYAPFVDQAYRATWRYVDSYLTGSWAGARHEQFARLQECRKGMEKDPSIELSPTWSVSTKAVNQGTTRVQGGHAIVDPREGHISASFHLFEEADGITDQAVFDAVKTMVDKGVSLWFLNLNPATATSPVQSLYGPKVKRYEISVLDHPNVVEGRDVIPGASNREWVEGKIGDQPSDWAALVPEHDARRGTFELPWLPSRIYEPRGPWWWRVLGKVPPTGGGDSAVPEQLYLSACSRDWRKIFETSDPSFGTLGVDVAESDAGHGDRGSIARRWRGVVQIVARPQQKDTRLYGQIILRNLNEMAERGCRAVEVRIDNGGGFGRDVYNQIVDSAVWDSFETSSVILCDFGGKPREQRRYANWVTEAYHAVAATLQECAVADPPPELRLDLCGRKAVWTTVNIGGSRVDVVALEPKKKFRERNGRSPDDGDSVALACYPRSVVSSDWSGYSDKRWAPPESGGERSLDAELNRKPWEDGPDDDWGDGGGGSGMRWRR